METENSVKEAPKKGGCWICDPCRVWFYLWCCPTSLLVGFILAIIIWYAGICPAIFAIDSNRWDSLPYPESKLVFQGDSNIDYWTTHGSFSQTFDNATNIGIEGALCKDIANVVDKMMDTYSNPEWIVLHCGENDMMVGDECGFFTTIGYSPEETFNTWKSIVEPIMEAKPNVRLLYFSTLPEPADISLDLRDEYKEYDQLVKTYVTDLAQSASGSPPIVFIDTFNGFKELGNPRSFYRDDELHLTSEAYAYWNEWALLAMGASNPNCIIWSNSICDTSA